MGVKVHLDLGEHSVGQAFGADEHHRFERVCLGAQFGALVGRDFEGWHGKWETRLKWRRLHSRSTRSISGDWVFDRSAGRRVRTTESRMTASFGGGRAKLTAYYPLKRDMAQQEFNV
ncbi:hypothetical protein J2794_001942 [Paraburkholderia terricola]|uniref:hypothetical protein n=1 Tax=Paraburkholderia terricola TaxID=169427 RepID=UPI00285F0F26|nr:hypothetical protein [Paraburkholderia terricola]MDR6445847.1 hypothetical protein [Paraburkholderia terricola]